MLNGKEPKIVNGPEVLNKFVGQSEENIRNLFAEAEAEYKVSVVWAEEGAEIIVISPEGGGRLAVLLLLFFK